MFARLARLTAVVLGLTFIVGMAAYAQAPEQIERPRQRPGIQRPQQQPGQPGMAEQRPRMVLAMAPVTRLLAPPSIQELERLGVLMNMTDEQRASLRTLYEQYMTRVRAIQEQRVPAVRQLLRTVQQPSPTKEALQAAARPIEQLDRQVLDAQLDFWVGFRAMLNPDQQAQAETFMERHFQMMEGGPRTPGPTPPAQQ